MKYVARIALAVILLGAPAFAGPVAYVINLSGQFGTMDLGNGAFTPLGPGIGANTAGALAGAPGGPFYSMAIDGHLMRVSSSGAVADVGDTGTGPTVSPNGIANLGGLTSGDVFALDFSNRLFSVNTGTGALSLLGTVPLPPLPDFGPGVSNSLNGDGRYLYYTIWIEFGPNQTGPSLFRIDPVTLQVTSTALTGLPAGAIAGSGFIGGSLYGFTITGEIARINTLTGAASIVGSYDSGLTPDGPPFTAVFGAVAAVPEPATLWLSGLALAGIAICRRRR